MAETARVLAAWAESLGPRTGRRVRGPMRFAFYGRVSTEDWQDPVTSRARQLAQAAMLVSGHGTIVAEFFDAGQSRTLAWARRPQAAALVAQLADPDLGRQRLQAAGDMTATEVPPAGLERPRKVLVHINNSNPILRDGSPERAAVEQAGVEIGTDEMEILA